MHNMTKHYTKETEEHFYKTLAYILQKCQGHESQGKAEEFSRLKKTKDT